MKKIFMILGVLIVCIVLISPWLILFAQKQALNLRDPLQTALLEITPEEKTFTPTVVEGNRVTYLDTLSIVIPEGAKVVAGKEGIYRFSEESFISLSSFEGIDDGSGMQASDQVSLIDEVLSTTPNDLGLFYKGNSVVAFKNLMLKKLFLPKGVQSIDYIMTMTEPWVWDAVITETDEETDIILFTSTGNYTILLVGKEAQDAATVILSSIEELKPGF